MNLKAFTIVAAASLLTLTATPNRLFAQESHDYKVLHTFSGIDGAGPYGSLISDREGNLYGTTLSGGDITDPACTNNFFGLGCGVVYKIDRHGIESVLYQFKGGPDGAFPATELLLDEKGNLYGTARGGGNAGNSLCDFIFGCGVVFKLDRDGNESVLYAFSGGADGLGVASGLIRDEVGNFYGTTVAGGDFSNPLCVGDGPPPGTGCGVVYKLDSDGNQTILHTFTGGLDGYGTYGSLVRDWQGNLFGAASSGGDITSKFCGTTVPNSPVSGGATGCGTVFKIDPSGDFSVLHTFEGDPDGGPFPVGWLAADYAGSLYGITGNGGNNLSLCDGIGCGTIFKIDRHGVESVLYNFPGGADGYSSLGSVIRDVRGNIYGSTFYGGDSTDPACAPIGGCGVVFKLDPHGKYLVLHTFKGTDGSNPWASLHMGDDGNLYGATTSGGDTTDPNCKTAGGCGVVFKITLDEN